VCIEWSATYIGSFATVFRFVYSLFGAPGDPTGRQLRWLTSRSIGAGFCPCDNSQSLCCHHACFQAATVRCTASCLNSTPSQITWRSGPATCAACDLPLHPATSLNNVLQTCFTGALEIAHHQRAYHVQGNPLTCMQLHTLAGIPCSLPPATQARPSSHWRE
jgi:hypothetical protein